MHKSEIYVIFRKLYNIISITHAIQVVYLHSHKDRIQLLVISFTAIRDSFHSLQNKTISFARRLFHSTRELRNDAEFRI